MTVYSFTIPNVFIDNDGRTFLVYAYAREKGLAIAEIKWQGDPDGTYGNASTAYAYCQDITVSLDASGNASILPEDVDGGSRVCTPDPGAFSLLGQTAFTCDDVGVTTVVTVYGGKKT